MVVENYAVAGRVAARRGVEKSRRTAGAPTVRTRLRIISALEGSFLVRMMIVMACVAAAALFYLAQASQVSVLQFNIAGLEQQHIELNVKNANLVAQMTALQTTDRIDRIASQQLHMLNSTGAPDIWVWPVVTRFATSPPMGPSPTAVAHSAAPLAWMKHALSAIESSL